MTTVVVAQYSAADQLSDIARQLREHEDAVRALAQDLTERQFHFRPLDGGWSIAQCIEHLELTGRAFVSIWDAATVEARSRQLYGDDAYQPGVFERWCLHMSEPPYRVKSSTRRPFEPVAIKPRRAVLESYLAVHAEVMQRIRCAEGIDLAAVRVKSPFLPWMSYSLGFSFLLFASHERRHLWQASRVKEGLPQPHETPVTI